jgi:hypothetical protein
VVGVSAELPGQSQHCPLSHFVLNFWLRWCVLVGEEMRQGLEIQMCDDCAGRCVRYSQHCEDSLVWFVNPNRGGYSAWTVANGEEVP